MKPKPRDKVEFEKVVTGDFVEGIIKEVQYEEKHKFKFKGVIKIKEAVRFVFELNGYQYKHYSRWMSFFYSEKANLYHKYLYNLVENAIPDMDFDIKKLEGMQIKTIWQGEEYQSVELIRPLNTKLNVGAPSIEEPPIETEPPTDEEGEIPF